MSKNPITTGRTATVNSSGILDCWVQQPVDNSPSENSSNLVTYQEKFKGPYSVGKEILSRIYVGQKLSDAHTQLNQSVSGKIKSAYPSPTSPVRNDKATHWVITNIHVQEADAGDHCYLTIDCVATVNSFDTTTLSEISERSVWNLSWQSYSVSPYAFCSNEQHQD